MNEEQDKTCCDDNCGCNEPQTNEPMYSNTVRGTGIDMNASRDEDCDCEAPQPNKMHDLVIKQADYGFLVKAGCQTLCIETRTNLIALFSEYVRDPQKVMKYYNQQKLVDLYIEHRVKEIGKTNSQKNKDVVNIGVVGSSLDDVRDYLSAVIPTAVRSKNGVRKYVLETQDHILDYYAISTVNHTRAMTFDKVVETHRARDNREFPQIMEAIAATRAKS